MRTPTAAGSVIAPVRIGMPAGSGTTLAAGTFTYSAYPPGKWAPISFREVQRLLMPVVQGSHRPHPTSGFTVTVWPLVKPALAPGPTAATVPANSWPNTSGGTSREL